MPYPPLVDPTPELSAAQIGRYARQVVLPDLGPVGQRRLRAARVLVVGAGGLGSPVLVYLAAAGIGTLGVVDDDVVDVTNLHRQVVHGQADLGRSKADSAADRIRRTNPEVLVRAHRERLTAGNAVDLVSGYHLVVDASDNFVTRYLVSDACTVLGRPEVWGAILGFDGQAGVFWSTHGPTYRDLHPVPPPPGTVPSCAEGGVLGPLCGVIGSVMAMEVVKVVTGIGEPLLGRVLVHDALAATWRTVRVRRNPDLPRVTRVVEEAGAPPVCVSDRGADGAEVTAGELAGMLRARAAGSEDFVLVDVREPGERDVVAIPGSVPVPLDRFRTGQALTDLPEGRRLVLYCQSGVRSARALADLRAAGRTDVAHLVGGVLAWLAEVGSGNRG
jgi:adenylyltransferase/sulfurtransferase